MIDYLVFVGRSRSDPLRARLFASRSRQTRTTARRLSLRRRRTVTRPSATISFAIDPDAGPATFRERRRLMRIVSWRS